MGNSTGEPKSSVVETLNLKWVLRLLNSSIGRKSVMGLTGLLLCGFLVAHLAGNLLLFSGQKAFNHYAHMLHEQEWLPLAEAGLLVLFVAHIYLAFATAKDNTAARSVEYAVKQSKIPGKTLNIPAPSNWMFASGAVVLGFLILHLIDLRLGLRPDVTQFGEAEAYRNTIEVLSNPYSRLIYGIGVIFLGFHLSHGFAAAFQSLGLTHPKYTPAIKLFGKIFAIAIAAGFFLIVVFVPMRKDVIEARKAPPPAAVEAKE
jgi:succinate dehydrogenase / fumarate reductase, cytochrome b subunit